MKKIVLMATGIGLMGIASCAGPASTPTVTPAISVPTAPAPGVLGNAPAATITEIQIPPSIGGSQGGIALAPDGTVYISVGGSNLGAKYSNGAFTGIPYSNPATEQFSSGPVAANTGGVPFIAIVGNERANATPRGGVQSGVNGSLQVALYSPFATVGTLKADAADNVWMSLNDNCGTGSCLAKISGNNPANAQFVDVAAYPINVNGIAPMRDGSAWVAVTNEMLRHYSTSLSVLSTVTLPAGMQADGRAAKSDGTLWWTDRNRNAIGEYANGSVHEFTIPTANSGAGAITTGADGAMWFRRERLQRSDASMQRILLPNTQHRRQMPIQPILPALGVERRRSRRAATSGRKDIF